MDPLTPIYFENDTDNFDSFVGHQTPLNTSFVETTEDDDDKDQPANLESLITEKIILSTVDESSESSEEKSSEEEQSETEQNNDEDDDLEEDDYSRFFNPASIPTEVKVKSAQDVKKLLEIQKNCKLIMTQVYRHVFYTEFF